MKSVYSLLEKDCIRDFIIIFGLLILFIMSFSTYNQVSADPLKNALQQRIGNYDFQIKTDPKFPITGQTTHIMFRISSVNGDDLVDLPIVIRLSKDGKELEHTNPILIPYCHYTYSQKFKQPGIYSLNIDITNDTYSNQNITFTFPIDISSSFVGAFYSISSSLPIILAIIISVTVAVPIGLIFTNRRLKKKKDTLEHTKR